MLTNPIVDLSAQHPPAHVTTLPLGTHEYVMARCALAGQSWSWSVVAVVLSWQVVAFCLVEV